MIHFRRNGHSLAEHLFIEKLFPQGVISFRSFISVSWCRSVSVRNVELWEKVTINARSSIFSSGTARVEKFDENETMAYLKVESCKEKESRIGYFKICSSCLQGYSSNDGEFQLMPLSAWVAVFPSQKNAAKLENIFKYCELSSKNTATRVRCLEEAPSL